MPGTCHSRDGARPRPPPSSAASSSRSEAADGSRCDGSAARHARRMSSIRAGTPGMSSTGWPCAPGASTSRRLAASREARRAPCHQRVQRGGHRVDVGGRGRLLRPEALRRRVCRGQRVPRHRLLAAGRDDRRQPEVRDADDAVAVDEDVRRLEVAVQDAQFVRGGERVGQVDPDPACGGRGQRPVPPHLIVERPARAQLHHHVRAPVAQRPRVVHVDDVRMPGQPPRRGHLAEEPPLVPF